MASLSAAPQPRQASLLDGVSRVEQPWKRTTETSREAVRVFEASGKAETLRGRITLVIRALWNRTQQSPTSDEIAAECFRRGHIPDPHPDHVKPRITELSKGYFVTVRDANGKAIGRKRVGGGLVEKAGTRKSVRSGMTVQTWRVIERGTADPVGGLG